MWGDKIFFVGDSYFEKGGGTEKNRGETKILKSGASWVKKWVP